MKHTLFFFASIAVMFTSFPTNSSGGLDLSSGLLLFPLLFATVSISVIGVWDRGAGGAIAPPVGILAILQVNIDLPQFPGRLNHCTQVQHTCTGTVIEISL